MMICIPFVSVSNEKYLVKCVSLIHLFVSNENTKGKSVGNDTCPSTIHLNH